MKIAIIGSGLAGLSTCWHALCLGWDVTLFDPKGVGGGASGVSTGLLHPFPGKSALRSWNGSLGLKATEKLLQVAEKALGRSVAERTGIFRPAFTEEQKKDYSLRAKVDPEVDWQEGTALGSGIWIPQGITVYSRLYLQGLWKACSKATLHLEKITSLKELGDYDQIVIATGPETPQFEECKNIPFKVTKGQSLICRWPQRLAFSLDSLGHISPTEDETLCQIGSTYERAFQNSDPDPIKALELKEKIALFYPPAREFEVVDVRAGVRISPFHGYIPVVKKLNSNTWVFTGLGSRGLLYHALLGEALITAISSRKDFIV
jgi:glycine/D-amino acid oxidase-like deaminating enzyme